MPVAPCHHLVLPEEEIYYDVNVYSFLIISYVNPKLSQASTASIHHSILKACYPQTSLTIVSAPLILLISISISISYPLTIILYLLKISVIS